MPNVVEILVTAKNLAKPAFTEATAEAKGLGGVLGKTAVVGTAALAGITVESVKMASSFQTATTRLVTSAGESTKNIDGVRKSVLSLAGQVGDAPVKLANGLYTVESAGFHGAKGIEVLKAAAQGAKAEGADLTTVADGVTTALNDYGLSADDAGKVTSQLITGVAHGKTNFQDFSASLHNVLPEAKLAHLGLADVVGTLSQMTAEGIPAAQASQQLRNAIQHLVSPTHTQTKALASLGLTGEDLRKHLGKDGVAGTMQFLTQKVKENGGSAQDQAAKLQALTGSVSGLAVANAVSGKHAKDATAAIKDIGRASTDSKGNVKGFAEVQGTLRQQVDRLNAGFQSLMIQLGTKLIPVLTHVVGFFVKHKTVTEALVGTVVGLTAAFAAYAVIMKTVEIATKLWAAAQFLLDAAMDANPIGIVVLAIAALIAGLVLAYKHSKAFRDAVNEVGKVAGEAFTAVWHYAEVAFNWIKGHWKLLLAILTGPIGIAVGLIASHWHQISSAASSAVNWIRGAWSALTHILTAPFSAAWSYISGVISSISSFISSLPGRVSHAVSSAAGSIGHALNPANWFAHGGTVGAAATGGNRSGLVMVGEHGPELVKLPTGSHVMSNPDTMGALRAGLGAGGAMHVQLEWVGGNAGDDFLTWLRRNIRIRGGNVQTVLGRN